VPLAWAEDGRIAYAFAPGATLESVLDQGPLPAPRVRSFTSQLLEALQHAHDAGIVHHDVKPANVIVRGERVRLLDFGFAKDLTLAAITHEETAMGTPHYMSPEQFRGARQDPRSDLYAVAATALHMLIGRPPYGRDVLRVLIGDLPADLTSDLERLASNPRIDRTWAEWFERGLAFRPEERFDSASSMAAALPRDAVAQVLTIDDLASLAEAPAMSVPRPTTDVVGSS
jgi:serine/threonine-protein kinase